MSETVVVEELPATESPPPFPRGCVEVEAGRIEKFAARPIQALQAELVKRGVVLRNVPRVLEKLCDTVIGNPWRLNPDNTDPPRSLVEFVHNLNDRDPDTELTNRELLRRGMESYRNGEFVIGVHETPSSKTAIGGLFRFYQGEMVAGKKRVAEGTILGILFNPDSKIARFMVRLEERKRKGEIKTEQIEYNGPAEESNAFLQAVIVAQKAKMFLDEETKPSLFTQEEYDRAMDWVLGKELHSDLPPPPKSSTSPRPSDISRRQFLNYLVTGAKIAAFDTLLAHIPLAPSLSKGFWQQLETATLGIPPEQFKREIEERFGIEIVGPSTEVREIKYSNETIIPTVEWDSPRLKMLIRTLSELPNHFYSPRKTEQRERKLQVALVDQPLIDLRGDDLFSILAVKSFCKCSKGQEQPMVILDKKASGATFLESQLMRETVIHEFTHFVTSAEIDRYINSIANPIGMNNISELRKNFSSIIIPTGKGYAPLEVYPTETWSKLFGEPTTFLVFDKDKLPFDWDRREMAVVKEGEDYYFKEREGKGKYQFVRVAPNWYVPKGEFDRHGEDFFKERYDDYITKVRNWERYGGDIVSLQGLPGFDVTYLSYGAKNFKEFFSVAAVFYTRGRGNFVRTYELYLGKERAEKLYDGMKQEIFQGREY